MANAIERTLNQIGNVVQEIFNGPPEPPSVIGSKPSTGQTCLEYMGMQYRRDQLRHNTWRREDIEYSRPLVLAEYDIQTEFKVSTMEEKVQEKQAKAAERQQEKEAKAAEKARKKAEKKARKEAKKASYVQNAPEQPGGDNTREAPVETTIPPELQNSSEWGMIQGMQYYT